jgi:hypothetical protein
MIVLFTTEIAAVEVMMMLEAVVAPGVGTRTQRKIKAPNVSPLRIR